MRRWPVLLLLGSLAALPAQAAPDAEQEAQRAQRALDQNRSEVERLLDLRMRHDLGLPIEGTDRTFAPDQVATPVAMEGMRRQLSEEDAATLVLRQRFDKLRVAVERLRIEAAARVAEAEREQQFVTVPTSGSTQGYSGPVPTQGQRPVVPAAPGGESVPRHAEQDLTEPKLDPMRARIHGSKDHQRVAQALFKAGQALMDRGEIVREQGRVELAKEHDDRAKERLLRAVDELAPLLEQAEPPYVALFYLGRCRELLFRYSERHEGLTLGASPRDFQQREQLVREPFLAISARDVVKTGERDEIAVLGKWGQAAQTAMEHFRWMNQYAGYDATAAIEALTWPGEKQR